MKVIVTVCLLFCFVVSSFGATTVTINTGISYQTMKGWEATAQAGESWLLPAETEEYPSTSFANYDTEIIDALVDFGINRLRVEIAISDLNATGYAEQPNTYTTVQPSTAAAGDWHYDRIHRQMDAVAIPLQTALAAQNEDLFINLCIVDFSAAGYDLENTPSEYAFFVNKVITDFDATYGFLPDTIEAILEPDAGSNTTNWTAAKVANNIVSANTTLVSNGFTGIKWIAPSTTQGTVAATWYADMETAEPTVSTLMSELSYHAYTTPTNAQRDTIAAAANADGIGTSMLEYIGADLEMAINDIERGDNTGWQQYTITFPYTGWVDDGAQYFGVNTTTWAVTITKKAKWLRHLFKYVRRGAVRKDVTVTDTFAASIPFANANGKYAVVIRPTVSGQITVVNLPAGTYGINYSYGSGSSTQNAPTTYNSTFTNQTITGGQNVVFTMADAGVVSVYDITYLDVVGAIKAATKGATKISGGAKMQ